MRTRPGSPLARFKRLHLTARGAADRCLAPHGLSVGQFHVLRLLGDEPGLTGAELARRTSVSPPSMNEMLATMLRARWLRREPDPRGGRGIQLFLTPRGEALIAGGAASLAELSDDLLSGIPIDRLDAFFATLDLIAVRAESH